MARRALVLARAAAGVTVLLFAGGASAQGAVFADDFESGTLISAEDPPGRWTALLTDGATASVTLGVDGAAARRGCIGVRFDDPVAARLFPRRRRPSASGLRRRRLG